MEKRERADRHRRRQALNKRHDGGPKSYQAQQSQPNKEDNISHSTPLPSVDKKIDYTAIPDPHMFDNLKRETDEIAALTDKSKKYESRKVFSNWTRYEEPEVNVKILEEEPKGADFEELLNGTVFGDCDTRFLRIWHTSGKPEQNESFTCEKPLQNEIFAFNVDNLSEGLACIPFYEKLNLSMDLFTDSDLKRMDHHAKLSAATYDVNKRVSIRSKPKEESRNKSVQNKTANLYDSGNNDDKENLKFDNVFKFDAPGPEPETIDFGILPTKDDIQKPYQRPTPERNVIRSYETPPPEERMFKDNRNSPFRNDESSMFHENEQPCKARTSPEKSHVVYEHSSPKDRSSTWQDKMQIENEVIEERNVSDPISCKESRANENLCVQSKDIPFQNEIIEEEKYEQEVEKDVKYEVNSIPEMARHNENKQVEHETGVPVERSELQNVQSSHQVDKEIGKKRRGNRNKGKGNKKKWESQSEENHVPVPAHKDKSQNIDNQEPDVKASINVSSQYTPKTQSQESVHSKSESEIVSATHLHQNYTSEHAQKKATPEHEVHTDRHAQKQYTPERDTQTNRNVQKRYTLEHDVQSDRDVQKRYTPEYDVQSGRDIQKRRTPERDAQSNRNVQNRYTPERDAWSDRNVQKQYTPERDTQSNRNVQKQYTPEYDVQSGRDIQKRRTPERDVQSGKDVQKQYTPERDAQSNRDVQKHYTPEREVQSDRDVQKHYTPEREVHSDRDVQKHYTPERELQSDRDVQKHYTPEREVQPDRDVQKHYTPERELQSDRDIRKQFTPERDIRRDKNSQEKCSPEHEVQLERDSYKSHVQESETKSDRVGSKQQTPEPTKNAKESQEKHVISVDKEGGSTQTSNKGESHQSKLEHKTKSRTPKKSGQEDDHLDFLLSLKKTAKEAPMSFAKPSTAVRSALDDDDMETKLPAVTVEKKTEDLEDWLDAMLDD